MSENERMRRALNKVALRLRALCTDNMYKEQAKWIAETRDIAEKALEAAK